jgi:hypothetical protein
VTVLSAAINVTRYGGGWPSDHAAVQAVLQFSGTASQGTASDGTAPLER